MAADGEEVIRGFMFLFRNKYCFVLQISRRRSPPCGADLESAVAATKLEDASLPAQTRAPTAIICVR